MLMECVVSAPYFTGIPEDVITNVWHWFWDDPTPPTQGECGTLKDALMGFYESCYTNTTNNALAPWVALAGWRIKMYDLATPKPRQPYYSATDTFAGTRATTSNIVPETALCLSYQADYLSGVNPASQRGRIYLGGIGAGVANGTVSTFPTPNNALVTAMCGAASSLAAGPTAAHFQWVVYSRKLGVHWPVTKGWVDNAMDTQRRRGQAPNFRTTWT